MKIVPSSRRFIHYKSRCSLSTVFSKIFVRPVGGKVMVSHTSVFTFQILDEKQTIFNGR
jgi:hypothetical protein